MTAIIIINQMRQTKGLKNFIGVKLTAAFNSLPYRIIKRKYLIPPYPESFALDNFLFRNKHIEYIRKYNSAGTNEEFQKIAQDSSREHEIRQIYEKLKVQNRAKFLRQKMEYASKYLMAFKIAKRINPQIYYLKQLLELRHIKPEQKVNLYKLAFQQYKQLDEEKKKKYQQQSKEEFEKYKLKLAEFQSCYKIPYVKIFEYSPLNIFKMEMKSKQVIVYKKDYNKLPLAQKQRYNKLNKIKLKEAQDKFDNFLKKFNLTNEQFLKIKTICDIVYLKQKQFKKQLKIRKLNKKKQGQPSSHIANTNSQSNIQQLKKQLAQDAIQQNLKDVRFDQQYKKDFSILTKKYFKLSKNSQNINNKKKKNVIYNEQSDEDLLERKAQIEENDAFDIEMHTNNKIYQNLLAQIKQNTQKWQSTVDKTS